MQKITHQNEAKNGHLQAIFQKNTEKLRTIFRDRATHSFFASTRQECVYITFYVRFVITPDEGCVDKRFRKLTYTKKMYTIWISKKNVQNCVIFLKIS